MLIRQIEGRNVVTLNSVIATEFSLKKNLNSFRACTDNALIMFYGYAFDIHFYVDPSAATRKYLQKSAIGGRARRESVRNWYLS